MLFSVRKPKILFYGKKPIGKKDLWSDGDSVSTLAGRIRKKNWAGWGLPTPRRLGEFCRNLIGHVYATEYCLDEITKPILTDFEFQMLSRI